MKIAVIGLGSMGKRRIRILQDRKDVGIVGIDNNPARREEVEKKFGIQVYPGLNEASVNGPLDCALVCTSPASHAVIIRDCLSRGLHVFTEINLLDDMYAENLELAKEKNKVLFLSSTLLYRDETRYIINRARKASGCLSYLYHVGQYLPDWHPWESYNAFFIGDARTNGCREIMAIELPWLVTAFGRVVRFEVMRSRNTGLNIQYDDSFLLMLEHESGAKGVFAVDVVCRKAVCHFEVYGENLYLTWGGEPDTLLEYDIDNKRTIRVLDTLKGEHLDGYASFITEDPYREELDAFFKQIENRAIRPVWDFCKDLEVLQLIDQIER